MLDGQLVAFATYSFLAYSVGGNPFFYTHAKCVTCISINYDFGACVHHLLYDPRQSEGVFCSINWTSTKMNLLQRIIRLTFVFNTNLFPFRVVFCPVP